MASPKIVMLKIGDICGKTDLNVRFDNNLDLLGMAEEIAAAGGYIHDPIHVWLPSEKDKGSLAMEAKYVTLRGYRRVGGCRLIQSNLDKYSAEVVKNASVVPAIIHDDMSHDEAREFVLDDNGKRPLAPSEVIKSIYFLFAMGRNEKEVASEAYNLIYRYLLKDEAPLKEFEKEQNVEKRITMIRDKLHTYLGNYLHKGVKLGPFVRDQILLFHKQRDGLLQSELGEVVHFKANTKALQDLSKAKTTDEKAGTWYGPIIDVEITEEGINVNGGGEQTNALLISLIVEAKSGTKAKKDEKKALTSKQLEDVKGSFRSQEAQAFLALASGDKSDLFVKVDNEAYRRSQIFKVLAEAEGQFIDPKVEELVKAIRVEVNVERVKELVKSLCKV